MAKLRILRGETTHAEFELKGQTARIGRGPENEIVLEDPGKGVSRTHAVIRFDAGRYILVDNKSQNGIWVSGSRVPSGRASVPRRRERRSRSSDDRDLGRRGSGVRQGPAH